MESIALKQQTLQKFTVFINGRRFASYSSGSYFKVFTSSYIGMIDASTSFCIKRNLQDRRGKSLTANSIIFQEAVPGKRP